MRNDATGARRAIMARQRHLPRAPITEALIDFRVDAREDFAFSDLKSAFEALDFGYYLKSSISEGMFELKLPPEGQPAESSARSAVTGLRLHSSDERYVAQCGIAGFTLSRLPPYEDWERLLAEYQRLWPIYAERTGARRVTRVATRYINNLRLPLGPGELIQTYLNRFADVPDEAPQTVEAFFQRFRLVDTAGGARVILTLALDPKASGPEVPVILDIDALMDTNVEPLDPSLWSMIERLRTLKNQCFFGALTERAAELYS